MQHSVGLHLMCLYQSLTRQKVKWSSPEVLQLRHLMLKQTEWTQGIATITK